MGGVHSNEAGPVGGGLTKVVSFQAAGHKGCFSVRFTFSMFLYCVIMVNRALTCELRLSSFRTFHATSSLTILLLRLHYLTSPSFIPSIVYYSHQLYF